MAVDRAFALLMATHAVASGRLRKSNDDEIARSAIVDYLKHTNRAKEAEQVEKS